MDLKYPQRNASYLEQNCNIWVTNIHKGIGTVCVKPLRNKLEAIQKLQHPTSEKRVEALQDW